MWVALLIAAAIAFGLKLVGYLVPADLLAEPHVVEVKIHPDGKGLLARTRDASAFHRLLNRIVLEAGLDLESVAPADDDVGAVYQYLIGSDQEAV